MTDLLKNAPETIALMFTSNGEDRRSLQSQLTELREAQAELIKAANQSPKAERDYYDQILESVRKAIRSLQKQIDHQDNLHMALSTSVGLLAQKDPNYLERFDH